MELPEALIKAHVWQNFLAFLPTANCREQDFIMGALKVAVAAEMAKKSEKRALRE